MRLLTLVGVGGRREHPYEEVAYEVVRIEDF